MSDAMFTVNLTVAGDFQCDGTFNANAVNAITVSADQIFAGAIVPASGSGSIIVDGDLQIVNKGVPRAVSFIAEDVIISGVRQWKLVRHDDFEGPAEKATQGWSLAQTSSCTGRDHFLGGHCIIATGEVRRRFEELPRHTQVRVTGRYHMIDRWQGETAFLKVDDHYVWAEHSRASAPGVGLEMCGSKEFPEKKMSIPIDVTMQHTESFLEVAFGSKGLPQNQPEDPCNRSFGVDDVMIYVR